MWPFAFREKSQQKKKKEKKKGTALTLVQLKPPHVHTDFNFKWSVAMKLRASLVRWLISTILVKRKKVDIGVKIITIDPQL